MIGDDFEIRYDRVRRELGLDSPEADAGSPRYASSVPADRVNGYSHLPVEAEAHAALRYEFGEIWARPGLDIRTRCFITVAALAALGHSSQLHRHINGLLNAGGTPEEVHEILLHVSSYAGIPAWENGIAVANEVFLARGILPRCAEAITPPAPQLADRDLEAACLRVLKVLNLGFIGNGPNAARLKTLPGWPDFAAGTSAQEREFHIIAANWHFGAVWGREGLPLRTRCLLTIGLLQVLSIPVMLHTHINNALNVGLTPGEIYETMAHAALYGGGCGWQMGMMVARHVIDQHAAARAPPA